MEFLEQVRALNILDAALFGLSLTLAILLRFLRAYLHTFGDEHTLALAFVFAVFGAIVSLVGKPLSFVIIEAIALFAVVLMLEYGLRKLGTKVPFLPADNQYVKEKAPVAVDAIIHVEEEKKP